METEPLDILLDCVDIFNILTGWVGVVKAKIADSVVFFRRAEIYAKGLCMTDVKISVRLWRKSCLNTGFHSACKILVDKVMYKI